MHSDDYSCFNKFHVFLYLINRLTNHVCRVIERFMKFQLYPYKFVDNLRFLPKCFVTLSEQKNQLLASIQKISIIKLNGQ